MFQTQLGRRVHARPLAAADRRPLIPLAPGRGKKYPEIDIDPILGVEPGVRRAWSWTTPVGHATFTPKNGAANAGASEENMPKKVQGEKGSVADLQARAAQFRTALEGIRGMFPEARRVAKDDRLTSLGKMGLKEAAALRSVVDAMDAEPAIFGVLADEDEGHDPGKLETALIRDRFDRHQVYAEMTAELEAVAALFADAALEMGALVKPVTLAAYEIAKPLRKRHKVIREKIAPALDYYGGNAAAAAAARRAKADKDSE